MRFPLSVCVRFPFRSIFSVFIFFEEIIIVIIISIRIRIIIIIIIIIITTISDNPRESFFLFQRIFILIQRFNEVAFRCTIDTETGHDE